MKPINSNQLSREYVITQKRLDILSWDYVIEHGKNLIDGELWWDQDYGYYICDCEGVYFTGLLYRVYNNLSLNYYSFYEDGVENGITIWFYPSGEVKGYGVYSKGKLTEIYYEWYENGMIKEYIDFNRNQRLEFDENGNIIKQGKAKR